MKEDKEALSALEKLAQETKERAKVFDQIDKSLLRPYSIQKLGSSFAEQYPALSEFAALKDALKTEPFQFGGEKLKEAFERLCEPFASTQALIDSYNLGSDSLVRSSFSELLDTERYRIPEGDISALESSMIPVLKNIPTSEMIDGMSSTLLAFSANLDSSWLHTDTSWAVQAAKILQVEMEEIDKTSIVRLNDLCSDKGRKAIFKYTGKMVRFSTNMGSLICRSEDDLGKLIDGIYMLFYENLEHIKALDSDNAVRNDDVYQCIFHVKDIRTDLRHDYEHGKNSDIRKKRNEIFDCYRHYTNRSVLQKQRDYVTLQRRLYDEILALEDHLFDLIETPSMEST